MPDQLTRNNHYVPQWYQRRFLKTGQSHLSYLNLWPDEKVLPDGRKVSRTALHKWGVKNCFCEFDLYTTHLGAVMSDDIEKFLFGAIDDRGAKAIRAFADGDMQAMHASFQDFFEYIAAQKLRTPKGLDWIKSQYSGLDQLHLMVEMQALRFMHCTMWAEGVREIVTADGSDVKFILSDHPVIVYNAALEPSAAECAYPREPSIEAIGTQTVFALDANTCLILTHLEYAQEPDSVILTHPRTNARHLGHGVARTDAFVRTRKLSRDEVITINHLIKSRARRFVAAAEEKWLYPEIYFSGDWSDIAQVLLPKDDLWQFGGELYVGYKDGSTHYQDAFGRTTKSHEYLRRRTRKTNPGANDPCGCGSGLKYKKCCSNIPPEDRPSWDVYSIRERNLLFCHAVQDILGLKNGATWDDVRRTLSDDQVKRIHQAFGSLWPEGTDLTELLPRPKDNVFRAIYLGIADPRTIEATVIGWLPYFDEVVLAHPFVLSNGIKPEYSPTESPAQFKAQTLKNVLLLLLLEPFLEIGCVHLIPDPGDINLLFGKQAREQAEQRTAGWKPSRKSLERMHALGEDDHRRLTLMQPIDVQRRMVRQRMPELSETLVDAVVAQMQSELATDPYALLQPIAPGDAGAQYQIIKGYGLEAALYLASLTGSVIYTDVEAHWQQLLIHAQQGKMPPGEAWRPAVESLGTVSFPIELNAQPVLDVLRSGQHASMRPVLQRLAEVVRMPSSDLAPNEIARQLATAGKEVESRWATASGSPRLAGRVQLYIPTEGFHRHDVQRLLLMFGKAKAIHPIPLALWIKLTPSRVE